MNKIKNLVIRNIYPAISVLLVTSMIPIAFGISKKNNKEISSIPVSESILSDLDHSFDYIIETAHDYKQQSENIQRRKEEYAHLPKDLDLNYMIATAKEEKEKIEEQGKEEFINNLVEAYEIGYNSETDTEINSDAFAISTDNQTFDLTDEEFELFAAVVASECNKSFDDALATASSVANRCDSERWSSWLDNMGRDGSNPIDHLTTEGQYSVYVTGAYKSNLDGNVPEDVLKACELVLIDGVRSHNYCSFRSSSNKSYGEAVVEGGNNYADELEDVKEKSY